MKIWFKCLVGVLLGVVMTGTWAGAGDKFIIRPVLDTSYSMDSNFYRTQDDERSVTTLTVSPGMEFGYGTGKSRVMARGFVDIISYDDQDSVPVGMAGSDDNDYIGHRLTLSADTVLFTRITAGVDDTWIRTRNSSERDALDNFTDINEYAINRVRPWMKYKISDRFSTGLEFKNTLIDYASELQEDSSSSGGKAIVYYEVSKFTTLDLEYGLREMEYDLTSSDYNSTEYRMNFSSRFKYFGFGGGVGFHEREFDQAGLADQDTISWHFSIKGQNPPVLDPGERPRSYMDLGFAQNFNDAGNGNEYYRANRVSLMVGHLFMEKLDARIETYYQKSDYISDFLDREDNTYFLAAQLAYYMNDWLTLTLKSGFETRESSAALNEYENNFVMVHVIFNYDLGSR